MPLASKQYIIGNTGTCCFGISTHLSPLSPPVPEENFKFDLHYHLPNDDQLSSYS